jgi:hypothetical protein
MMLGWDIVLIQEARSQELLRQVERERLVRQARAGRAQSASLHCRALTWLGRQLVAWGWRLQERYGAAMTHSMLRPAREAR